MPENGASDDALNQYWNALVPSEAEPPTGDLDPGQAETVRRLHAMARTPPPAEIRARVDHVIDASLLASGIAPHANGHSHSPTVQADIAVFGANGRDANRPSSADRSVEAARALPALRSRLATFPLATALLLLLTLGLGIVVGGLGRSAVERRAVLPAAMGNTLNETVQSPEGSAEMSLETIFATTLPPEMLPTGGYLNFGFWRLALAPGVSTPASSEGQSCCRGPQITHVLAGELTVQVDGPLQLFRGSTLGSSGVAVAPGTATVVRPGDTIVYDFASPAAYTNQGASPVQIINATVNSSVVSGEPWMTTMDYLDGSQEFSQFPLPDGPLAVSLVRAVLPPNGEVPAPPDGAIVLEVGENSDASIGKRADDGSLFNINDTVETIYIVVLEPLGTPTLMP